MMQFLSCAAANAKRIGAAETRQAILKFATRLRQFPAAFAPVIARFSRSNALAKL
jgi:hypothetical protein